MHLLKVSKLCNIRFFSIIIIFISSSVFAETESSRIKLSDVIDFSQSEKSEAPVLQGSLGYLLTNYTSSIPGHSKLDKSDEVSGDFHLKKSTRNLNAVGDFYVNGNVDRGNTSLAVQQLYVELPSGGGSGEIAFGRKRYFWNQLERSWGLGIFEPQFEEDPLNPKPQGLAGLFMRWGNSDVEVLGLVSPLYIPTMGPPVREEQGAIVSDSRWYREPARSGNVLGQETDFRYSIDTSDVPKLVTNGGLAMRATVNPQLTNSGWWGAAAASYKPINRLPLRYDRALQMADIGSGQTHSSAPILLKPVAIYSTSLGLDIGHRFEKVGASVSYLRDMPQKSTPPQEAERNWVQQQPGNLSMWGAHLEVALGGDLRQDTARVSLDYLDVQEDVTIDYDADGAEASRLFPNRTDFQRAAQISLQVPFEWKSKKASISTKFMREFDQKGIIWGSQFAIYPWRAVGFHAGFDVLAVDDSSDKNTDDRFINRFRANDRYFGGMNYVF